MTASLEPSPIRVQLVDLESPLPALELDETHAGVWLVARRAGVPQAIVEVEPGSDVAAVEARLAALTSADAATPPVDDALLPAVTVVVPSIITRVAELDRCLTAFDALDYPRLEILLVDNRRAVPDDDPLPGLLTGRRHVRSVRAERPGISSARNAGLAAARGEVVVFTDDDVHVDRDWLRAFGRRFVTEPGLDAVTGLILPAELETPAQIYFERYYGGFSGERTFRPLTLSAGRGPLGRARIRVTDASGATVRTFAVYGVGAYGAGANMAFRRATLERLGGFDLALGTGTAARGGEDLATLVDVLWSGGRVGYEPSAVVYHQHRRGYDELLHQLDGNGLGFTAMLSSLVLRDPRHLVGLGAQLPLALRRMAGQSLDRLRGRRADGGEQPDEQPAFPAELVRRELRGMPRGPLAYLRSRRAVTRWDREHAG